MNVNRILIADDESPALIQASDGRSVSFGDLQQLVASRSEELKHQAGSLVFLGASLSIDSIVDYLALTEVGSTVAMLDPATDGETLGSWIDSYRPAAWWGFSKVPNGEGVADMAALGQESVLLTTSGSTGSPRFVRLSAGNVQSNAAQIVEALRISESDRALAHLPVHYSFGLSVLNSHLLAGAALVLCSEGALQREFWKAMSEYEVSSLSGVPYSFQLFRRAGLEQMDLPHLRHLTQAGGRMDPADIERWHHTMIPRGVKLWVMYGQTEATARISVLPPEELPVAGGSVGYPLHEGHIEIVDPDSRGVGEVVYSGPNVMLGYAEGHHQLGDIDEYAQQLRTGDLGRLDDAGRLWITGRMKRIAKIFGTRVSLDDLESRLGSYGVVAVVDNGEKVTVFVETDELGKKTGRSMERHLGLPPRSVEVIAVESLPSTPAGKIDYQKLKEQC